MERHLLTAGAIDAEHRRARKPRILLKQAQRLSILMKGGEKARVLPSSKLDHAQLCDHDRPTENRTDGEEREDDLARDRRVIDRKNQAPSRDQIWREHLRVTWVSNSAVSEKRKRDSNDEARMLK